MKINHLNGTVLFEGKSSFKGTLELAVQQGADLRGADLCGADLWGADLWGADLRGANLWGANLRSADLRGADLRSADLGSSHLRGADLRSANLWGANLRGANLCGANLGGVKNIDHIRSQLSILPEGELIGWKKVLTPAGFGIVKLKIPLEAQRSNAASRKCRASYAEVLQAPQGAFTSYHGPRTEYVVGHRVVADKWDEDWTKECSNGIHFFITREEAENY